MLSCSSCGAENREEARFCDSCGAALAQAAPARETRKTVTVLFCDVTGSTSLGERLDAESLRDVMHRYWEGMRAVILRHGGRVEKFAGDAVMAVFGVPRVHEDDALRAVRAAAEMREALVGLNAELERTRGVSIACRTGVNTGEAVVGDLSLEGALFVGDTGNVAARLEQAAQPGEILIGAATYRMVRGAVRAEPLEPLTLKGKAEPVPAFRLVQVQPGHAGSQRSDAPLVGRHRELRLITDAYEHAVSDRACHLVTILGVAGVGKSRLVAEAIAGLSPDPQVLTGRCLPYGDGITFWPIGEIVKQAAGITEADSAEEARSKIGALVGDLPEEATITSRVCELIGLSPPAASQEECSWAVRKLLETQARRRPLVVTLDDLQWAEPGLLSLVEHVADWAREAPMVVLCMARPEFLESQPSWGGGKMNAVSLLLEPLSAAESEDLVAELAGGGVPQLVRTQLLETCGGNPLFLEETLASLIEQGAIVRSDGGWRAAGDGSSIQVPPTIQALLSARLDRLGREELSVIEGAAVVGQVFYRGAVSELAPEGLRPDVGTYLLGLVRKDLVRPDTSVFAGEEAFRFRHLLIRDAAYQAMPKQTRAELHERFARWLERVAADRAGEYEEIVGYHLEQAFRYREQLGPVDDHSRALGVEAGQALGRAGVRAAKRADFSAAVSLLSRAISLCPNDPEGVDWLMRLARSQHMLDNADLAMSTFERAVARAEVLGDPVFTWRARLAHSRFRLFIDPEWSPTEARTLADAAIPALEELKDDYGLALAWRLRAESEGWTGQMAAWGRDLERAVEHARRADAPDLQASALADFEQSFVWGPTPVAEGLDRCRQVLQRDDSGMETRLWTSCVMAVLEAMAGHFDASARMLAEAAAEYAELGVRFYQEMHSEMAGQVDLLTGEPGRAAEKFRAEFDSMERSGDTGLLSLIGGLLSEALYRRGSIEDAETYARVSERYETSEPIGRSRWRAVVAKVLARRGELDEAERLAREAVEITAPTDLLQLRGDFLLDLAEVLGIAGQTEEARQRVSEAIELYERKGDVTSAARARSLLQPSEATSS